MSEADGEVPTIEEEPEPVEAVGDALDEEADPDPEPAEAEEPPTDVDEAEVDLTDDDMGGDLFAGVEEAGGSSSSESSDEPDQDDDGDDADDDPLDGVADGLEGGAGAMEDAINDGAARLAVVGLTDDDFEDSDMDLDDLETELRETFEAFRLGFFGSQAIDEYVIEPADGDVSPAWGLAGSMLMAVSMAVFLRPDGDEKVAEARETIMGLAGGAE